MTSILNEWKNILFFLFVGMISILHAQTDKTFTECEIYSDMTRNDSAQLSLSLTFYKQYEIMLFHNASELIIVPEERNHESNTTGNMSQLDKLISLAKSKLGDGYVLAKAGPDQFDCSGFVYYIFTTNNISIPRASLNQSQSGKKLLREELEKGDILFFDAHQKNYINHSGIYLGNGKFIHSSSGKAYGVTISDLDKGFYLDKFRWGIRKIESTSSGTIGVRMTISHCHIHMELPYASSLKEQRSILGSLKEKLRALNISVLEISSEHIKEANAAFVFLSYDTNSTTQDIKQMLEDNFSGHEYKLDCEKILNF